MTSQDIPASELDQIDKAIDTASYESPKASGPDNNPETGISPPAPEIEAGQNSEQPGPSSNEADNQAQRRKALDICLEIESLLDAEDPLAAGKRIKVLRRRWKGLQTDKEGVDQETANRFQQALDRFSDQHKKFREEWEWHRWANRDLKEKLCRRVEALDNEDVLSKVSEEIKKAQKEWKRIGSVSKDANRDLWQRFHKACERNFMRCKEFYDELDRQRAENLKLKEDLCGRAEELSDSTDWKTSGEQLKSLQAEWKETGPCPKKEERKLYRRFRKACNRFFERRHENYKEFNSLLQEHLTEKEKLCTEAEALTKNPQWQNNEKIRALQARWKKIGPVPHEKGQEVWNRFRAACESFYTWVDEQRPDNLKKKEALCAELEAFLNSITDDADLNEASKKVIELQKQWKKIGPVPKKDKDKIWQRFHQQCNDFFNALRQHSEKLEDERLKNQEKKYGLLRQAEELAGSGKGRKIADELRRLQKEWKETGPAPREQEKKLFRLFQAVCNDFFKDRRQRFEAAELDRRQNLKKKETLCIQLEHIIGKKGHSASLNDDTSTLTLAEQLKLAFETNFVLAGKGSDHRRRADEVRHIQQQWKEIGPVPREHSKTIWNRYRRALDTFYERQFPQNTAKDKNNRDKH